MTRGVPSVTAAATPSRGQAAVGGSAQLVTAPELDRDRSLPVAVRTFALLAAEGASLGLFGWALTFGARLPSYAVDNELPRDLRQSLLLTIGGGAFAAVASGVVFLARARLSPYTRLWGASLRLAPLLLIALLPFLLRWQVWQTRELTYGVVLCIYAALAHSTISASVAGGSHGARSARAAELTRAIARGLDRAQGWLPSLLVVVGATGYAVFFAYHTVAHHRSVLTASFDLGLEDNLLWNVVHGGSFMKTSPPFGPVGSHFGYHATLFAYVIAPFYLIWQRAETLLVFQAVTIGAAAIPLYLFAKQRIGTWGACLLALVYLLYPPVHGSNLYDFHYLPLGVFFLWLTLWLVDAGRFKWAALAVVLTLSVREDVAADLSVVGVFLLLRGKHPRAGAVVALVAGAYFVAMKMFVMPHFLRGGESFIHQWAGLIPKGGAKGYGSVLMTVVGNPVYTLTSLLEPEKFLYLVQLGAPLCFFPWRRPIGFLLTLPGFFFTLLGTRYLPLVQISFQYTAHWTAFLFVAIVANLETLRKPLFTGDAGGITRQRIWLTTIALLSVLASHQYGAIFQQNTVRGGFGLYKFERTEQDRKRYEQLHALVEQVPPRAKMTSSELVVPHVSNRPDSYTLRVGVFDAEYLIAELPARGDESANLKRALNEDFGVVDVRMPFMLAKRGHPKDRNKTIMARVR